MDQRDVPAGPEDLERRFRRRVAAADDDDTLAVVGMRLGIEMVDVRQLLARDVQQVRMIEVAGRDHDVAGMANAPDPSR